MPRPAYFATHDRHIGSGAACDELDQRRTVALEFLRTDSRDPGDRRDAVRPLPRDLGQRPIVQDDERRNRLRPRLGQAPGL